MRTCLSWKMAQMAMHNEICTRGSTLRHPLSALSAFHFKVTITVPANGLARAISGHPCLNVAQVLTAPVQQTAQYTHRTH